MSGILRWLQNPSQAQTWHLSFAGAVTLCGAYIGTITALNVRWLSEGAPARRCPRCAEVISFRLGLPVP